MKFVEDFETFKEYVKKVLFARNAKAMDKIGILLGMTSIEDENSMSI